MNIRTAPILLASVAMMGLSTSAMGHGRVENKINRMNFASAMQKLWEDHVSWTRMFIISAAADLPDKDATTARLLQNQVDIGNAIKPFYGAKAGDALTALLKEHIVEAADLVGAAKAGDDAKVATLKAKWFQNADAIADFLAKANPAWSQHEMRMHMHDHLNLTLEEATARLKGNYADDIRAYDKVHNQIVGMASMLSMGLWKQFPNRFK
jgi:hypothetical protein